MAHRQAPFKILHHEERAAREAILNKTISEDELNKRVACNLKLKKWVKENQRAPLSSSELFTQEAKLLKEKLYSEAITLVNPTSLEPPIALLQIGGPSNTAFTKTLQLPVIHILNDTTELQQKRTLDKLKAYNSVIVVFQEMTRRASESFGITKSTRAFVEKLQNLPKKQLYVLFGSPYAMNFFQKESSFLIAYEDDIDAQIAAAETLLGKRKATGVSPIK